MRCNTKGLVRYNVVVGLSFLVVIALAGDAL